MRPVAAFLIGGLFGLGLLIGGMTDTDRVQNWLDIFGAWDPTLAFVMGGAILPMAVAWRVAAARGRAGGAAALGGPLPEPRDYRPIDRDLVTGSALFGVGWALVGLCPGPSVAVLGFGGWPAWLFLAAMAAGMAGARFLRRGLPDPDPVCG